MPTPLTTADHQQILDLYSAGLKWAEIETRTGHSRHSIGMVLAKAGVTPNRNSGHRVDVDRIAELFDQGMEVLAIAQTLGCSVSTLYRVLSERGLRRNRRQLTAEQNAEIIAAYEAGEGGITIAHRVGVEIVTVYRTLRRAGVPAREHPGLAHPHFFDRIDTEAKAYWLGFIAADGYVFGSKFPSTLEIRLARKDHEHLEKLRTTLGVDRPVKDAEFFSIGKSHPMSTLSVHSTRLVNALISHGVTPNKSLTLEPWDGPPELMRHYWRGLVDGDGSLSPRAGSDDHVWTIHLVGSRLATTGFATWASHVAGRPYAPIQRKGEKVWRIAIGGVYNVRLIVAELYAGCTVALDRKQALARRVLAGR